MTDRGRLWAIGGFGLATAAMLAIGAGTLGGLMALVQLCFLVGFPVALQVADDLRSRAAVVVVAFALSIAIAAIAVQSLVWFELATAELVVLLATAYGAMVTQLMWTTGTGGERTTTTAGEGSRW